MKNQKQISITSLILVILSLLIIIPLLVFHIEDFSYRNNSNVFELLSSYSLDDGEFLIDSNYNKKKQDINNNADLTNLNDEFANLWKEKINSYYQEISNYFISKEDTIMLNKTQLMKEEWEKDYSNKMSYYEDFLLSVYATGSIVPIKISDYNRILNRNKAIELYYLCLNLGIDVNSP